MCAILLGSAVEERLVDAVHEHTQGMADLVDVLITAWAASGAIDKGRLAAPPADPPQALVAALRPRIDELSLSTRTVLEALSAGADLDDDLLSATSDIAPDDLGDAIDDLGAAGLLVGAAGDVVPLVAAVVTSMTPVADRRRFHARLAAALRQRGAPATRTGEHLVAAGAQGADAAAAYAAAGDATLVEAPELAAEWYDRAIAAGVPAAELAARRAEAAALTGDAATALRLADGVMAAAGAPDRARALAVVAALLPGRGLWRRSASAYAELAGTATGAAGPTAASMLPGNAAWPLLAALGTIATGGPVPDPPARASSPATGTVAADDATSGLEVEALRLTRDAVVASVAPDGGGSARHRARGGRAARVGALDARAADQPARHRRHHGARPQRAVDRRAPADPGPRPRRRRSRPRHPPPARPRVGGDAQRALGRGPARRSTRSPQRRWRRARC